MAMLTRKQLEKLNKEELVTYALNITNITEKFDDLEKSLAERFEFQEKEFNDKLESQEKTFADTINKLESELTLARKCTSTLRGDWEKKDAVITKQLSALEREAYRTAEYVNFETIELSKIPASIPDKEVPDIALKILNCLHRTDNPYTTSASCSGPPVQSMGMENP